MRIGRDARGQANHEDAHLVGSIGVRFISSNSELILFRETGVLELNLAVYGVSRGSTSFLEQLSITGGLGRQQHGLRITMRYPASPPTTVG